MKKIFLIIVIAASLTACKKENVCYACNDFNNNYLFDACGKSETEAYNQANAGFNGGINRDQFNQRCHKK